MTYGELIKELRISAGKTQKQLGVECGFPASSADVTVRRWEEGKLFPKITKLRTLAAALNVPLENLLRL
jgi:transcriptional regulator with XRE-family HTH domain